MKQKQKRILVIVLIVAVFVAAVGFVIYQQTTERAFTQLIGRTQEIDGMTLTLDYAAGDEHNLFVILTAHIPEDMTVDGHLMGGGITVDPFYNIPGESFYNYELLAENKEERTQTYLFQYKSPSNLIGAKVFVQMSNYVDNNDLLNTIISDSFRFDFRIKSDDQTAMYPIQRELGRVYTESISVSPALVTLRVEAGSAPLNSETITVVFHDGTQMELTRQYGYRENEFCNLYGVFEYLTNIDSISHLMVNGEMIEIGK